MNYLLLEDNGDIYAEVCLPNTYTREEAEEVMALMARATGTKYSGA